MNQFSAVFEQRPHGWWIAYIEELPGVNSQGATLEEARANLREAFALVPETDREIARAERRARGAPRTFPLAS